MKTTLLVLMAALALVSCSSDVELENPLVGKWKCDMVFAFQILEIRQDGTCSVDSYWADGEKFNSISGKYTYTETELKLDSMAYSYKYHFANGNLVLVDSDNQEFTYFKVK